jgi:hypothetical protein
MTGESVEIVLPFSRFASDAREVTSLYRELREPCYDIWPAWGSPKTKPDIVV